MEDEQEQRLAERFAGILDGQATAGLSAGDIRERYPDLAGELEALSDIDRAVDPEALPERLSGHRILSVIGRGGMGRVLLAEDEALRRRVAIKMLAPEYADRPALRTRFMAEARAMARLNHPNVVRIYSLGPASEPPHFVMEHLDGVPLTRAGAALTFEQRAEMVLKVVETVHFLHGKGVIHRDLKPQNVLVGPDLEPKLLDFGLILDLGDQKRLSRPGEIAGTPEYLSPEQAAGGEALDARSDVFSLGAVLYELLTGQPPFRAAAIADLLRIIREEDPVLPRRRVPEIPRALQNVCLKALEKDPARRYASAADMAGDLRRYLAGEAVYAEPAAYSRLIAGKVGEHLRELEGWRRDQIVSEAEYDGLRRRYDRLLERDDAWIMEARRLTLPQVTLYLGAWVLAVGAALLTFFRYPALAGFPAVLTAWAAALPAGWIGFGSWRRERHRVAVAWLLAFCLLAPIATLVTLEEFHLFTGLTMGQARLELFHRLHVAKQATNAQLWWSILAGIPVCWWIRRFTGASVFTLLSAVFGALLALATLVRMGMLDWLESDPGRIYFRLIPCAAIFMTAGLLLERKGRTDDSRYFYPFAVAFTWAALSGLAAFHEPYARWLKGVAPWTRGQLEYLFILNAGVYFLLDRACDRMGSGQVRMVGKSFRFVIPGHVMTSLLLLGVDAQTPAETKLLAWLLPAAACVFVFASIPRQMKNFFATGLLFFAIGVARLQHEVFHDRAVWPVLLLAVGLSLMAAAANYAALRVNLARAVKALRR